MTPATWLDRAVGFLAPQRGLRRIRARVAADLLLRHYDAAGGGRRTQGWKRPSGDVNADVAPSLARLRQSARDLVRNNPHADNALDTIANQVVGYGIVAKPIAEKKAVAKAAADAWAAWALTTACDADGRHDFYGLEKLVMRSVAESGEVLVRRRFRLPEDGLPLPFQLQLLEPDFLDTDRSGIRLPNGGRIIHGIEFNPIGQRVAYWLFPEHPGTTMSPSLKSARIPAENVLHVYHQERVGQIRAATWFAPVLLKMKDYDEYDDAQLMKQKIAACLAVLTSDVDGTAAPLGTVEDTTVQPQIDSLEPGMIMNVAPGRTVTVVDPPRVGEFEAYSRVTLHAIAVGIGLTHEDLTGSYENLPFSAARMSKNAQQPRLDDWRWRTIIPQFCQPVWGWAMEAALIMGLVRDPAPRAAWTAPPMPYIDPAVEGLAFQRNIRGGAQTWSESVRERGYDPDEVLAEMAADNAKFDKLGIVLDSDPRMTTQAGLPRESARTAAESPLPPTPDNGNGNGTSTSGYRPSSDEPVVIVP